MRLIASLVFSLLLVLSPAMAADALPSWRDGAAKERILSFIRKVTAPGGAHFVPREDRIAVFDNDGTLLLEQPIYIEIAHVMDRLKAEAAADPALRDRQPYKAAIEGDTDALTRMGSPALIQLVAKTGEGKSPDAFQAEIEAWLKGSRHPRFGLPYDRLTYRPMQEMIDLLKRRGFAVYIVTGSNVDFVRAFAQRVYGLPPHAVIGSRARLAVETVDGQLRLRREAGMDLVNDGQGKVVGISQQVGKRPILAFGNSDGDYEMLQWTTQGPGLRLGALIRHDDARREYRYDRQSHVGRLDKALDDAPARGWLVVSMEKDWRRVFRAAPPSAPRAAAR